MLAGEVLRLSAARFPDKTAVIDGARRLTYREFDVAANRFANALIGLGLEKGARLAMLAPNSAALAIAHYGAARAGVIFAPISVRSTPKDLAYILDRIGASALAFTPSLSETVAAACKQAPSLRHLIATGPAGADALDFDDLLARSAETPPDVALAPSDPYAMTFTGGTTGFPKAVLVTHASRYATAVTCGVEFGLDERDVMIVATPMFHAAGLYVWFHPSIMLGCTCVMMAAWDAGAFIDLVERHGATGALLVPTQLSGLINHPDFSAARLASLRHINYAGAPMALALYDRLRAALPNVAFTENYGQSETGPMTVRRAFHPYEKRGTVGRPAHNVETRVVGPDGSEVPAGVVGEIVTRGPHVLKEYWGDPEQTAALFRGDGGWLWTGDLGVRDADGFIALVDRSKDMIISGGENIYPTELENALFQHPDVAECAVFGVPDEHWGEVPAAHVVRQSGASVTEEELIAFVAARVARHKRPRLVRFVDRLPKTAVGKIQKNLLRAPYWEGRPRRI